MVARASGSWQLMLVEQAMSVQNSCTHSVEPYSGVAVGVWLQAVYEDLCKHQ